MKKNPILFMAVVMFFLFAFTSPLKAQSKGPGEKEKIEKPEKKVKLSSKTTENTQAANVNIKRDKASSDVVAAGNDCNYTCATEVDNYSSYTIDIYLDGFYAGTVPPKSYITVATCNGYTKFYGLSAGKTKEWLSTGDCQFKMTWTLFDN
jgi:hypothetical protein